MKCVNCKYWKITFCSTGIYKDISRETVEEMGLGCSHGCVDPTNEQEDGEMKLFIWDGVHNDYSKGYAIAVAKTKEEAINVIAENSEDYEKELYLGELYKKEPKVYIQHNQLPYGFWVGGGA